MQERTFTYPRSSKSFRKTQTLLMLKCISASSSSSRGGSAVMCGRQGFVANTCVHVCVRACVCVCARACVCVWVYVSEHVAWRFVIVRHGFMSICAACCALPTASFFVFFLLFF